MHDAAAISRCPPARPAPGRFPSRPSRPGNEAPALPDRRPATSSGRGATHRSRHPVHRQSKTVHGRTHLALAVPSRSAVNRQAKRISRGCQRAISTRSASPSPSWHRSTSSSSAMSSCVRFTVPDDTVARGGREVQSFLEKPPETAGRRLRMCRTIRKHPLARDVAGG